MKFITLHLSQSRARIALRSQTLLYVLFTVGVIGVSCCASRRSPPAAAPRRAPSPRDRDRIFGRLLRNAGRPVASLRGVYTVDGDEGRSGGRRGPRDDRGEAERRLRERGGRAKRRAPLGRAGREETEIEKGRGRWRLQGYTRPEQGPASASASERTSECARRGPPKVPTVPARGEAPARLSRMLLHAMLLRYTSNIKVEEGMEKRATWANSTRNGRREAASARKRERERERRKGRVVGRRWSAPR